MPLRWTAGAGVIVLEATTNPDNAASRRVLRKVGMTADGQRDFGTHMVDFFAIDRADWARGRT